MAIRHGGRRISLPTLLENATEVVEKRDARTTVFDNGDGSFTGIIGPLAHYWSDGQWLEIDNRWKVADGVLWDYQMVDCGYVSRVRRRFDCVGPLLRCERDGHWLTYNPRMLVWSNTDDDYAIVKIPQSVDGTVVETSADSIIREGYIEWANAYGTGINVRYSPLSGSFVKDLIINSKSNLGTPPARITNKAEACLQVGWTFNSDLDLYVDGEKWDLTTRKDTGTNIEFKDSDGNIFWSWRYPKAHDANMKEIIGTFRLVKRGLNSYTVTVQIPWEWFNDPERVYPVTIDPDTIYSGTNDGQITGQASTGSLSRLTSTSYDATGSTPTIGQQRAGLNNWQTYRLYFEFNTSTIGAGAVVSAVTLTMMVYYGVFHYSTPDYDIDIYKYNWSSPISTDNREANYDGALASTKDQKWRDAELVEGIDQYLTSPALDITWPSTTDWTRYCVLSSRDVANQQPTSLSPYDYTYIYLSEAASSKQPYISITYTLPGGGNKSPRVIRPIRQHPRILTQI